MQRDTREIEVVVHLRIYSEPKYIRDVIVAVGNPPCLRRLLRGSPSRLFRCIILLSLITLCERSKDCAHVPCIHGYKKTQGSVNSYVINIYAPVGAAIAALLVKAPETVGMIEGTTEPEISVGVPKLHAFSRLKI